VVFKHQLDEWPPLAELMLLGFQWLAISIPGIIIVGKVVGALHYDTLAGQIVYLQKMSFMVSLALFAQVMWGHRLPLILGPSTVLLIGVITSSSFDPNVIYSSIMVGGIALATLSFSGLFGYIQKLFTPRVVAVVLILIALTLMPTVMNLITVPHRAVPVFANLIFAITLTACMFLSYRYVGGIWKSTMVLWAMIAGSIVYYFVFPQAFKVEAQIDKRLAALFFVDLTTRWSFEPGVLVSFLFCFFALSINDLGSIQSMKEILNPSGMLRRINRGIAFTGLANVLAGFLGIIGPVNFSLSPGVIAATRSASRFTLIPASIFLFLLSFSPSLIGLLGNIPPAVIGSSLIYILYYQVVAGMSVAFRSGEGFSLKNSLVIGVPAFVGTVIAFLPTSIFHTVPDTLRPIVGNGFVMGVLSALIMEHLIFKKPRVGN
jgi:xanthine/uracil permease